MRTTSLILTLVVVLGYLSSCAQEGRFGQPDDVWTLGPELVEISALSFTMGDSLILCLQDERGTVYGLDPNSGRIRQTWKVAGKGDFEGIEMADSILFLLRSDGKLYGTRWDNGPSDQVIEIPTGFPEGTDVEGLGYDEQSRLLLLGIKDYSQDTLEARDPVKGWVYWNLAESRPQEQVCGLTPDSLQAAIMGQLDDRVRGKLLKWLDDEDGHYPLGPSGIAVHPLTREIWMISSRGKLLMVFRSDGDFDRVYALNANILPQPEGIAFNRKGDLFIASEGKKNVPARIAVFRLSEEESPASKQ
ncbi:MAG: hypothetical protein H6568_09065 [Lewinellaceae bacterium]|nr:hypothetical protein [Saprospiraceae bacterium]MCB9312905.1 hypothetical protein [Lewinellaceae bacterium]HRW74301.1 hypothetical protein [Saprospiraceae bacterium]